VIKKGTVADIRLEDSADEGEAPPSGGRALALVQRATREPFVAPVAAAAAMPGAQKPGGGEIMAMLNVVHRTLRGRYWIAILLGILVGATAAALTWKRFALPQYRSTGLLKIAYTLPEVVGSTDRNAALPMFATYMQSQRLLITSRRVIDVAVQDPIWRDLKVQVPDVPDRYFAEHLKVDIAANSEFIQITVTDSDPNVAAAAVRSTINAYQDLYLRQDELQERQRTGILADQRLKLEGMIAQLDAELKAGAKEYGTTNLSQFFESAAFNVARLQTAVSDIRLAMSTLQAAPSDQPATQPHGESVAASTTRPSLSAEEIARNDGRMASHLANLEHARATLAQLLDSNLGEEHREVKAAKRTVERAEGQLNDYLAICQKFHQATNRRLNDGGSGQVNTVGRSMEELKASEKMLVEMIEVENKKMIELGSKARELRVNEEKLADAKDELYRTKQRIELLQAELKFGGRLSVISSGDVPLSPERDRRTIYTAAAGGTGLIFPAAAIVALGLVLQRRFRYSDDAKASAMPDTPLLGILPTLKDNLQATDELIAAGQCIHQIRVALSAQSRSTDASVYLMTSATSGEGKTSLTMALGLSFAASGVRTLIIDADMVGRHLTRAFDLNSKEGLREALATGSMRNYLRQTAAGLYVLTAGHAAAGDACTLSTESVRKLIHEARRHFEVVLIDSGPILGSLEAAIVGQESDAAIISISRGQQRSLVEHAFTRLTALKVPVAGMIFNRAGSKDFSQSAFSSTSSQNPLSIPAPEAIANVAQSERLQALSKFGPVVHAAILGLPANCN